jgi:hypothetical protein
MVTWLGIAAGSRHLELVTQLYRELFPEPGK